MNHDTKNLTHEKRALTRKKIWPTGRNFGTIGKNPSTKEKKIYNFDPPEKKNQPARKNCRPREKCLTHQKKRFSRYYEKNLTHEVYCMIFVWVTSICSILHFFSLKTTRLCVNSYIFWLGQRLTLVKETMVKGSS